MNDIELTLLSEGQIWGNNHEKGLEALREYGTSAAISDLCILTGCFFSTDYITTEDIVSEENLNDFKKRSGFFWTCSAHNHDSVYLVGPNGNKTNVSINTNDRSNAIRPILQSSLVYSQVCPNSVYEYNDVRVVEYGKYPQYVPEESIQKILESKLKEGLLNKTGRSYTFDSNIYDDYSAGFSAITYDEYEYQGAEYIRIKANPMRGGNRIGVYRFKLSNGIEYKDGDFVWIKVSPVKWLIDHKTKTLISLIGLVSGIRFNGGRKKYKSNFNKTEMKSFLDNYMLKDLLQSTTLTNTQDITTKKEQIEVSVEQTFMEKIEYLLATNDLLKNKYQKEYDDMLNYGEDILTLTPINKYTLTYLLSRMELDFDSKKCDNYPIKSYLENIKREYLDKFSSDSSDEIKLTITDIDNLYEKFLKTKNNYSLVEQRNFIIEFSYIYLFNIYENIDNINIEELQNSHFGDNIKTILLVIKSLIESNVIENNIRIDYYNEYSLNDILLLINKIKFNANSNNKKRLLEK